MKSKFTILMFMIMSVVILSSSCKKEEKVEVEEKTPVVDVRVQSYANYNGNMKLYLKSTMTLLHDSDFVFSVVRNPIDDLSILIVSNSETMFKGSKIAKASNGFTFDIESQSFVVKSGDEVTIVGQNSVELNGTKYHGVYSSSDKKMQTAFTFSSNGVVFIGTIEGTKK